MALVLTLCQLFCTARLYDGGFMNDSDPSTCLCYYEVPLSDPGAIADFTLSLKQHSE